MRRCVLLAAVGLCFAGGRLAAGERYAAEPAEIERDGIRVAVTEVFVGQVPLAGGLTREEVLRVTVEVENRRPALSMHFSGWAIRESGRAWSREASLRDDRDRDYAPALYETPPDRTLGPGESVTEHLVFDLPAGGAQRLTLSLPGAAVGGGAGLEFTIPLGARKSEGPSAQIGWPEKPKIQQPRAESRARPSVDSSSGSPRSTLHFSRQRAGMLLVLLFGCGIISLYLLPTIVAVLRKHPQFAPILVVNLLLGWSGIGWVAALAMSVSEVRNSAREE